jgi:hypothetical protein
MFNFLKRLFSMQSATIRVKQGSSIIINGQVVSGSDVIISGNNTIVHVDGKEVTYPQSPTLHIEIRGNVDNVNTASGDITIHGQVNGNVDTASGDVRCGNVGGNVDTASGDVSCGNVSGNVETVSGDIHRKK